MEQNLRLQLVETERRGHLDRLELEKLQARTDDDRKIFIEKINRLKKWVVGYDDARRECKEMRETVSRLEAQNADYRASLAILEEAQAELTRTRAALDDNRSRLEQTQTIVRELRAAEKFYRYSEEQWKADCHALSSAVWILEGDLEASRKRGNCLSSNLSTCRTRLEYTTRQLDDALGRIASLDSTLNATREEHHRVKFNILATQKEMQSTIERRERDNQAKSDIIDTFISGIGDSTRMLHDIQSRRSHDTCSGSQGSHRRLSEEEEMVQTGALEGNESPHTASTLATELLQELNGEILSLRCKVSSLTSFASGYAACIFDQCASQEDILRSEGHALEGSSRQVDVCTTGTGTCRQEPSAAAPIMQHLDNSNGSRMRIGTSLIDWPTALDNEDDRRHILAQLGNRMQMGLYSLKNALDKRRRDYNAEMKQLCRSHDRRIGSMRSSCKQETTKLQATVDEITSKYQESEANRKRLESEAEELSSEMNSAQSKIHHLEGQLAMCKGQTKNLEERLAQSEEQSQAQQATMAKQGDTISQQEAHLKQNEQEIQNRDLIINQLERLLEKTTQNYAALMEKERIRLATNQPVAIQAQPDTIGAGISADFISPRRKRKKTRFRSMGKGLA